MKRFFAFLAIWCTLAVAAVAQNTMPQPGPQGTTANQNAPQMPMNPPQQSAAPSTTATTPATNAPAASDAKSADKSDAKQPEENKETASTTAPPKTPHTEMFGTPSTGPLSADPLLQPPPLPPNRSTLIGGLARKVDRIKNRVVVAPFGGGQKITVQFDERSHIYRDNRETTILGIRPGDRVYLDTMLIGPTVFARNLRVVTVLGSAEAAGQVLAYDPRSQTVRMLDKLTNSPVVFRITAKTELSGKSGQPTVADIRPGTLVKVVFAPGRHGGDAQQLSVLAIPGTNYLFAGRVTNLDLHLGILDVDNQSDGQNYELHFNPAAMENRMALHVGAQVAANAAFDGRTYTARDVTIVPEQPESAQQ